MIRTSTPTQVKKCIFNILNAWIEGLEYENVEKVINSLEKSGTTNIVGTPGVSYISPKQYAAMMGISVDSVKRHCKQGLIPWVRVGRQMRIKVEN